MNILAPISTKLCLELQVYTAYSKARKIGYKVCNRIILSVVRPHKIQGAHEQLGIGNKLI